MYPKQRLIVALDTDNFEQAEKLVDILSPEIEIFKVGIVPFTAFGARILEKLNKAGKKVFLDLKIHDIPNTVESAVYAAANLGVFMVNCHCFGGTRMLEAAVKGKNRALAGNRPILLGVTVLTSMADEDMQEIGIKGKIQDTAVQLAVLAYKAGFDGAIASPQEARVIKEKTNSKFIIVSPGIRPDSLTKDDQRRTLTAEEALTQGADYIVVGRPIIQAPNPLLAAKQIIQEIDKILS